MRGRLAHLAGRPIRVRWSHHGKWQVYHCKGPLRRNPECALVVADYDELGRVGEYRALHLGYLPTGPVYAEVVAIEPVDLEMPAGGSTGLPPRK